MNPNTTAESRFEVPLSDFPNWHHRKESWSRRDVLSFRKCEARDGNFRAVLKTPPPPLLSLDKLRHLLEE
jgi:hypothetical protein